MTPKLGAWPPECRDVSKAWPPWQPPGKYEWPTRDNLDQRPEMAREASDRYRGGQGDAGSETLGREKETSQREASAPSSLPLAHYLNKQKQTLQT